MGPSVSTQRTLPKRLVAASLLSYFVLALGLGWVQNGAGGHWRTSAVGIASAAKSVSLTARPPHQARNQLSQRKSADALVNTAARSHILLLRCGLAIWESIVFSHQSSGGWTSGRSPPSLA